MAKRDNLTQEPIRREGAKALRDVAIERAKDASERAALEHYSSNPLKNPPPEQTPSDTFSPEESMSSALAPIGPSMTGDLSRTPYDVADRHAPAVPEKFVCLACCHYMECGHYDANAAPWPWTNVIRLCRHTHYEAGPLELTDECISYCTAYKPHWYSLRGLFVWFINRSRIKHARETFEMRGVSSENAN